MEMSKTWTELKNLVDTRYLHLQYEQMDDTPARYFLYAEEGAIVYTCKLLQDGGADVTDFETNYKANANKPVVDRYEDGRVILRAESRPDGCTTMFTMAGDSATEIGAGTEWKWDFSNTDNDVTAPTGYKRKQIDISFIDSVWIKEGAFYFHNALKGSYIDIYIVCPAGGYYKKNDGTIVQATEETVIHKYVNKHGIQGDCPMGDELNTETSSGEVANYLIFRAEITVPDTDSSSNGYLEMELYRERTVILE